MNEQINSHTNTEILSRNEYYELYGSKFETKFLIILFFISAVANVLLSLFFYPMYDNPDMMIFNACTSSFQAFLLIRYKHWGITLAFSIYGFFCMGTTGTGGVITLASIYATVQLKKLSREYKQYKSQMQLDKPLSYGSTFEYENWKITIGHADEMTYWTSVQDIKFLNLPVRIKNLGRVSRDLEEFKYSVYDPWCHELAKCSVEDTPVTEICYAGVLSKNNSTNGTLSIEYKGRGEYRIKIGGFIVILPDVTLEYLLD